MRKVDRERNGMDFPKLYYPELYLLEGGYKKFYATHPVCLCTSTLCVSVFGVHVQYVYRIACGNYQVIFLLSLCTTICLSVFLSCF